jgi:methionyl-tRNA formyltransferase
MRVVFFGTPSFAANVLDYLLEQGINIVAVVSKPDRPKGRSKEPVFTPVKATLQNRASSLPIHQPEEASSPEFLRILQSYHADLFVVVAYGEILKQSILDMPCLACINLHASLLPDYRGAAPIQRSIIDGKRETGVTIMHMVKKMDAGDVIKKVVVPIEAHTTFGDLELALCTVGKEALREVILSFGKGDVPREVQDISKVTFAPKIELEDCEIDWTQPALTLHNLIRGVNPHPGAWCYVNVGDNRKRLKIYRTNLTFYSGSLSPGSIFIKGPKKNIQVVTGDQALELVEVQLEGKKTMHSAELFRGFSESFSFKVLGRFDRS